MKTFPLRSNTPADFEYEFTIMEPHPDFTVYPLKGGIQNEFFSFVLL